MVRKQFVVVCYDIQSNSRRKKVSDLLETHGIRINKSVFECMVTEKQLTDIKRKTSKLINDKTDSLLFYEICLNCFTKIDYVGSTLKFQNPVDVV